MVLILKASGVEKHFAETEVEARRDAETSERRGAGLESRRRPAGTMDAFIRSSAYSRMFLRACRPVALIAALTQGEAWEILTRTEDGRTRDAGAGPTILIRAWRYADKNDADPSALCRRLGTRKQPPTECVRCLNIS